MSAPAPIRALAEQLYAALGRGDEAALRGLLTADFSQRLSAGLPLGLGGHRVGPDAAIREGWWAIGARFRVRAEPACWLPSGADRLVVVGTYRGTARSTGGAVEAAFAHVWTARADRLASLEQVTDTAAWSRALDASPGRSHPAGHRGDERAYRPDTLSE